MVRSAHGQERAWSDATACEQHTRSRHISNEQNGADADHCAAALCLLFEVQSTHEQMDRQLIKEQEPGSKQQLTVEEDGASAEEAEEHRHLSRLGKFDDAVGEALSTATARHECDHTGEEPVEQNYKHVALNQRAWCQSCAQHVMSRMCAACHVTEVRRVYGSSTDTREAHMDTEVGTETRKHTLTQKVGTIDLGIRPGVFHEVVATCWISNKLWGVKRYKHIAKHRCQSSITSPGHDSAMVALH